jgi:hypothetical protein
MKIAAFLALVASCEAQVSSIDPGLVLDPSVTLSPVLTNPDLTLNACNTICADRTHDSCVGSWTSCEERALTSPITTIGPITTITPIETIAPITTVAPITTISPILTNPDLGAPIGAISPRRRLAQTTTTSYNCVWTCSNTLADPSDPETTLGPAVSNPGDVVVDAIPACLDQCSELRQQTSAALVSKGCVDQIKGLCDAFGVLDECKRCKQAYDQGCLDDVRYGLSGGFECPRTVDESIGSGAAVVPTLALAAASALLL